MPRSRSGLVPAPASFPLRPRSRSGLVFSLMALCLLLSPLAARAGHYDPTYSGSSGAQGTSGITSLTTQCSGPLNVTFTWNNDGDPYSLPPPAVIITQTATASWTVQCFTPSYTGNVDTGLGANHSSSANYGDALSGTKYVGWNNPGQSFTYTPATNPEADVTASGTVQCIYVSATVTYSAAAIPVTVGLTGTTLDNNRQDYILVGQGCMSSLNTIPSTLLSHTTYYWDVTGNTFQSWTVSADQSYTTYLMVQAAPCPFRSDRGRTMGSVGPSGRK